MCSAIILFLMSTGKANMYLCEIFWCKAMIKVSFILSFIFGWIGNFREDLKM